MGIEKSKPLFNFKDKERTIQASREKKHCGKIRLFPDFSTIKKSEDNETKFGGKENGTQQYYIQPNYPCIKTTGILKSKKTKLKKQNKQKNKQKKQTKT